MGKAVTLLPLRRESWAPGTVDEKDWAECADFRCSLTLISPQENALQNGIWKVICEWQLVTVGPGPTEAYQSETTPAPARLRQTINYSHYNF